jgi:arsenate reductase
MTSQSTRRKILFLCTGNSCRSQMAEGWARALHDTTLEVWSAGVEKHGLNQRAVQVMKEAGVDIAHHRSELVDDLLHIPFDFVITVCGHAHESCPVFPGQAKVIHRGFPDPPALAQNAATEEEALAPYRRVRDEIRDYISDLPSALNS